jgi:uncharacterized membrane protein
MKLTLKHPVRTWVTGLLALLPLAATLLLLTWTLQFLSRYLGPGSTVGQLLTTVGLGVAESELVGYLLGLLLVVVIVYAVGLLVETGLQRGMARLVNGVMLRIPVVRTVYDVAKKLVGLLGRQEGEEMQSMAPVWVYFGGKKTEGKGAASTAALAFLATPKPVLVGGQAYLGVMIPTSPVPVGGGLLYVPPQWVEPAEVGMEAVTSIYVSMGVTSGQYLTAAPQAASALAPQAASASAPQGAAKT